MLEAAGPVVAGVEKVDSLEDVTAGLSGIAGGVPLEELSGLSNNAGGIPTEEVSGLNTIVGGCHSRIVS